MTKTTAVDLNRIATGKLNPEVSALLSNYLAVARDRAAKGFLDMDVSIKDCRSMDVAHLIAEEMLSLGFVSFINMPGIVKKEPSIYVSWKTPYLPDQEQND